jgi:cyclic pyranopterin phosphate synthase
MSLSHLDDEGHVNMVDITDKERSDRRAKATGTVEFPDGVLSSILEEGAPKGDVLATARVAGIEGAKNTPDWIPLAHPINLSHVRVDLDPDPENDRVTITAEARASDATGVEMEALTAVNAAALTLYDMCKSEHKGIRITDIHLLEKEGGASGTWRSSDD